jgi:formylglycine-generating enzyme required for sulfatase activity
MYQDYFWPLRGEKHWEALGPNGGKWLAWCNRLLAPPGDHVALALDQFQRELDPIRVKPGMGVKGFLKRAAAVLVVGAIGAAAYVAFMQRQHIESGVNSIIKEMRPATLPSEVATPIPAPATQPASAPLVVTPPPPPVIDPQVAIAIQAAQQSAQNDIDKETSDFGQLSVQMRDLAPDLHDFEGDVVQARNVALSTAQSVDDVNRGKQDVIKKIRAMRQAAVTAALTKAKKTSFKHAAVAAGFADWQGASKETDAEKSLLKLAAVIHALQRVDTAYPADPALGAGVDPRIAGLYGAQVKTAMATLTQAVAAQPDNETAAISDFTSQASTAHDAAVRVAAQSQAVTAANAQLNAATYPSQPPTWTQLQAQLAAAGGAVTGWPDAGVAAAQAKVNAVLDALQTKDVDQLRQYAAAATPPALLAAVCSRWPALHGDAELDSEIFIDLKKGLGKLPPPVTKAVDDLWTQRVADQADAQQAALLADLAGKMGLDVTPAQLGAVYFNARLTDLQKQFSGQLNASQQSDAAGAFLAQIDPLVSGRWPLAGDQSAALKKIAAAIDLSRNPPPHAELSADFRHVSGGSDDLLYTPPFDADHPMRFKKLKNAATGQTFYLCTTEATINWFIGMFDDPHKVVVLRKLMDFTLPGKLCGPCVWRTNFIRGGLQVNPDASWLPFNNHRWDDDDTRYVPGGSGPSNQSPMQYVSPLAAMYAAKLTGARLPTVDEWQTALAAGPRDNNENTSGRNWENLRNSLASLNPPPNSAATWSKFKIETGIDALTGGRAPFSGSVRGQDNDVLWFRDVPPNADAFHDMEGNVLEWVLTATKDAPEPYIDSDDPAITIVDEGGSHNIANQDDPALSAFYPHVKRIGLSATSDKSQSPDKPAPPADPRQTHHHQFFDVGFRLALDDPDGPSAPPLAAVIAGLKPLGI